MRPELINTQRRGRKIALTADEIDTPLAEQRVCRVATPTSSGTPHVSPLWFVWDHTSLWLYSVVRSSGGPTCCETRGPPSSTDAFFDRRPPVWTAR